MTHDHTLNRIAGVAILYQLLAVGATFFGPMPLFSLVGSLTAPLVSLLIIPAFHQRISKVSRSMAWILSIGAAIGLIGISITFALDWSRVFRIFDSGRELARLIDSPVFMLTTICIFIAHIYMRKSDIYKWIIYAGIVASGSYLFAEISFLTGINGTALYTIPSLIMLGLLVTGYPLWSIGLSWYFLSSAVVRGVEQVETNTEEAHL